MAPTGWCNDRSRFASEATENDARAKHWPLATGSSAACNLVLFRTGRLPFVLQPSLKIDEARKFLPDGPNIHVVTDIFKDYLLDEVVAS